jgi:hypothetical protein
MHQDASKNCHCHAYCDATGHDSLSLPGNKREIPERHMIFGIEKAAAIEKPIFGVAGLSFILVEQVDSSSQAFGCRFMESVLLPLELKQ